MVKTDEAPAATDPFEGKLALRIEKAAVLFDTPSRTIRDHCRRGDIRSIRLGKGRRAIVLIPVEEIRRLLGIK